MNKLGVTSGMELQLLPTQGSFNLGCKSLQRSLSQKGKGVGRERMYGCQSSARQVCWQGLRSVTFSLSLCLQKNIISLAVSYFLPVSCSWIHIYALQKNLLPWRSSGRHIKHIAVTLEIWSPVSTLADWFVGPSTGCINLWQHSLALLYISNPKQRLVLNSEYYIMFKVIVGYVVVV